MAKKTKKFSVSVALRAVVGVPVTATSLAEAQAFEPKLNDVAGFVGNELHDYRIDVVGVSEDTGWDFVNE